MDGQEVILVGAFREVVELTEDAGLRIVGIFDAQQKGSFAGYPILGSDEAAEESATDWKHVDIVLSPDLPAVRRRLCELYTGWGYQIRGVIAPRAMISRSARLGGGVFVQAGANISADVSIGDHVRINSLANVMHDTAVGPYATIAPNAVLLGRCVVGEEAYIGANATILPGRQIGARAVVGAGAVVTRDVVAGAVVAGSPARRLIRPLEDKT